MQFKYTNEIPDADSFMVLYESTGWDQDRTKTKDDLYEAIKNSWHIVSVFANNKLIGFGRVLSDGKLHAFIVDLIILSEYKQKGIGSKILTQLTNQCKNAGINDIQLFCAKDKKQFYLKNNFVERPENAPGMQFYL